MVRRKLCGLVKIILTFLKMKFTDTEVTLDLNAKICTENTAGDKGYTTPRTILAIGVNAVHINASTYEIPVPSGSPILGDKVKAFVSSDTECTIIANAGIKIPSRSSFVSYVLPASMMCIIQIEYTGSFWSLEAIVGDYAL